MMTPPIGVPDFSMSADPLGSMSAQTPQIPTQIAQRGGMFGGDDNMRMALMAAISGLMARRHPEVSQMMGSLMQNRMSQQQAQQTRQQQLADEKAMFDYKAEHSGPDDFTQRIQALNAIKPGLGQQYAETYARNGGGLGIVTNPQTGQQYVQPGATQPPAEAIARLKANPAEAPMFDEIFGHGASAGILGSGGPSPSGSGGF